MSKAAALIDVARAGADARGFAPLPAGWDEARHSPVKIAAVVAALAEAGVAAPRVLAGTGLREAQLHDPDTLTSTAQLYAVMRRAAEADPRPGLGLRIGRRLRISSYGMYGYALLCAPSLRAALDFAQRHHVLANPLVPIRCEEGADALSWVFPGRHALALPALDEPLYRVLIEMQMAIHFTLARDAMGEACLPSRVLLGWPRDEASAALAQAFGCPVVHGRPRCELQYSLAWLERPPQLANALTAAQISRECARLVDAMEDGRSLSRRVYRELMRTPGRFPGIEAVAATLGMTGRTLRRRLQGEGASYADLLASVRRALAEDYLSGTRMSIEDVAGALAFSNARSFRHAFVRWTGRAPSEFRRER